jgi:hypothetical protein
MAGRRMLNCGVRHGQRQYQSLRRYLLMDRI